MVAEAHKSEGTEWVQRAFVGSSVDFPGSSGLSSGLQMVFPGPYKNSGVSRGAVELGKTLEPGGYGCQSILILEGTLHF